MWVNDFNFFYVWYEVFFCWVLLNDSVYKCIVNWYRCIIIFFFFIFIVVYFFILIIYIIWDSVMNKKKMCFLFLCFKIVVYLLEKKNIDMYYCFLKCSEW